MLASKSFGGIAVLANVDPWLRRARSWRSLVLTEPEVDSQNLTGVYSRDAGPYASTVRLCLPIRAPRLPLAYLLRRKSPSCRT
jgi:hypothetical protein